MNEQDKVQIVWFRTDLRVYDNSALSYALQGIKERGQVVAIYIATPSQWREHNDAPIKIDFWKRSLQVLEKSLKELAVPLCLFEVPAYKDIPRLFEKLCACWNISSVTINKEYPLNEVKRDLSVRQYVEKHDLEFCEFDDRVLLSPEQILTKEGLPYKVFTPFAKQARHQLIVSEPYTARTQVQEPSFSKDKITIKNISEINWPVIPEYLSKMYESGEKNALKTLEKFAQNKVQDYKVNRDFPSLMGTSHLSHHLSSGTISVRQCWRTMTQYGDNDGIDAWCTELLWRDFYTYVAHHYPRVCMNHSWRQDLSHLHWRKSDSDFEAWCHGQTGIPLVDAAMRQLLQTGWMHNRLRMVTAMFLSKNLFIDWRRGERWFMQHLIDGDFAANNGGWQWSASTGTDAAPYFRIFNPVTQSKRFDKSGDFIRKFVPELSHLSDNAIHEPALLKLADYPLPLVDLKVSRTKAIEAFKKIPLMPNAN